MLILTIIGVCLILAICFTSWKWDNDKKIVFWGVFLSVPGIIANYLLEPYGAFDWFLAVALDIMMAVALIMTILSRRMRIRFEKEQRELYKQWLELIPKEKMPHV